MWRTPAVYSLIALNGTFSSSEIVQLAGPLRPASAPLIDQGLYCVRILKSRTKPTFQRTTVWNGHIIESHH
jgi:hypothetical protein